MKNYKNNEIPEEKIPEEGIPEYEEIDGEFVWSNRSSKHSVPPIPYMTFHPDGVTPIRYYFVEEASNNGE